MNKNVAAQPQARLMVAILAILALGLGGMSVVSTPKARAAEVTPTVSNLRLVDLADNPVTEINATDTYRVVFDFRLAEANPGDTFTVTLPEGFRTRSETVQLGDIATARPSGNGVITVTFTDAVADQVNFTGGFSYPVTYPVPPAEGQAVQREVQIGNDARYLPEVSFGDGPPQGNAPFINKWSGKSTEAVNRFERVRLSGQYSYAEIGPVDDQVLAKWFIEFNNWDANNPDAKDPEELGGNIVVTDVLQNLGDFSPEVVQLPREAVSRVLTDEELAAQLAGPYVLNRQSVSPTVSTAGRGTVELMVGVDNGPKVNFYVHVEDDAEYLTITERGDGTTELVFKVSDYIASKRDGLSAEQLAIVDSPTAQYAMNYIAVLPKQNARIENTASFTSDNFPVLESDGGWFRYIDPYGWGSGEFRTQPTTSVTLNKVWEGLDEGEEAPEATFTLLANGEPAVDLERNELQPVTLAPGTTSYTWENLPTQLDKGEPITYTVEETSIEGFDRSYGEPYVVNLEAEARSGTLTVTNTKTPVETTPETTTSATTEPTEPTTSVTTTPVEPTEPSKPAEPTPTPGPSSENNRCIANASTSPVWWLIPVALVAVTANHMALPQVDNILGQFAGKLANEHGMKLNVQNELNRVHDKLGIQGVDPLRQQRAELDALNRQFQEIAGQFHRGIPGADTQMIGTVVGIVILIASTAGLFNYWCTTPEGQTLGAKLSS